MRGWPISGLGEVCVNENQESVVIRIKKGVLDCIDRIAVEQALTRDQIINSILENHLYGGDDWIDQLIN